MTDQPKSIDWRELCEELANHLQGRKDREVGWPGEDPEQDLLDRVHTLLAQPEPEDDVALLRSALEATAAQRRAEDDDRAALSQPEPKAVAPTNEELTQLLFEGFRGPIEFICDAEEEAHLMIRNHVRFASAALARYGRPALLSQPEPEVVGPIDDSGEEWQWYTYCPEEGIELYPNRQQAQSAAQSIMGSYEVAAHSDGWHEDMELVSWGMLVPFEQAQVVDRGPADPGGEFDEWVRYELRAVARWGRPAQAPAGEAKSTDGGLKPCPFCGSQADLEDHRLCWFVRCSGCGAGVMGDRAEEPEQDFPGGYWEQFRQSAVKKWNLRRTASAPAPAGEVGEVATKLIDRCCDEYATACSPITPDDYDESDHRVAIDAVVRVVAAEILKRQAAPVPAGERQAAPVPVPVSERPWEREGWCHPQERWAWFYNRRVGWRDANPPESLKPPTLFPYTHSVPFNALPLPSSSSTH